MNSASELFDFLESHEASVIDRFEFVFAPFESLRRDARLLLLRLRESDPIDVALASRLRTVISESLTVPVPFLDTSHEMMSALGDSRAGARWSIELRRLYDSVRNSAEVLGRLESPLRTSLGDTIQELRANGLSFKVLCHRRAVPRFESLPIPRPPSPLSGEFLHTVADYRNSDLFDVLIKVGPLRSSGWGSAPDAVLTAPRFHRLAQWVWYGCNDEPGFGYDPASATIDSHSGAPSNPHGRAPSGRILWNRHRKMVGHECSSAVHDAPVVDELNEFSQEAQRKESRSALLLEFDRQQGLLCPPACQVLSFDPDPAALEPIGHRIPSESLVEGMYVIVPDVEEVDLGSVRAQPGRYSRIWRNVLVAHRGAARAELVRQLSVEGLDLYELGAAVENWCRPPDTVIHAPRQLRHFQVLLRVLGLWDRWETILGDRRVPFWKLAWQEIRRSRGEAIQAGFQEHEIVDEELQGIATSMLAEIRRNAAVQPTFDLQLPQPNDISGAFRFYRVSGIEDGFSAPDSELRSVRALGEFERWRN